MKDKKMLLFDWNGTLIDDMPIWYKSISKIFELYGVNPPSIEDYFRKLEQLKSYPEVYHSFGINLNAGELDEIYLEEYQKHLYEIRPMYGAIETLDALTRRGIILGLVTAQLAPVFDPVFLRFSLSRYFKHLVTNVQKKAPVLSHLCFLEKIEPQNCCYVGDAPSDIRHAKTAGVKSVAYLTRYIPQEILLAQNPDFAISDLRELTRIIEADQEKMERDKNTATTNWHQLFW